LSLLSLKHARENIARPHGVDVMTAPDVTISWHGFETAAKGRNLTKGRVLRERSGVSKTIEDGADLGQIRLIGKQQLQGDPRLAGIQRIGGDEPASDEIDLPSWVVI
jgi:hypothetical protein